MSKHITTASIYADAYKIKYNWENYLPKDIYRFHELLYKEFNAPIELQMGTLLPFIASLAGPKVRGLWATRENCINFYSLNVAASGTGKTACRTRLVSEPLEYVMKNLARPEFPDFEINRFTRAGKLKELLF